MVNMVRSLCNSYRWLQCQEGDTYLGSHLGVTASQCNSLLYLLEKAKNGMEWGLRWEPNPK